MVRRCPMLPVVLLWVPWSLGCAISASHSGLIQTDDDHIRLIREDGRSLQLMSTQTNVDAKHLEGCTLTFTGHRVGGRVWLGADWRVLDAGDGSMPFVGTLQRDGLQWRLRDRNSGSVFYLDPDSLGGLEQHADQMVLIVGYILGAHRVNVVRWKALE